MKASTWTKAQAVFRIGADAIARAKGAVSIGIAENTASPLAMDTDIHLAMVSAREGDPDSYRGTTGFAVRSAIIDALQTALIEETGIRSERFALIHPGGAVGARLGAAHPTRGQGHDKTSRPAALL